MAKTVKANSPISTTVTSFSSFENVLCFDILAFFLSLCHKIILYNLCYLSKPDKVMIFFQASEFAKLFCDLVGKESLGQMTWKSWLKTYSQAYFQRLSIIHMIVGMFEIKCKLVR